VLAIGGVSGIPNVPSLPGLDDFSGEVIHSSQVTSGTAYAGHDAIVARTGNSGHDVAQDLHENRARITMVQRSATTVVSLVPSGTMVYALYSEGPPIDDIDLITASIQYPVLNRTYQWLTKKTSALDKKLLDGLAAAGLRTDGGADSTGFHMKYLRYGGGYYINVGCSDPTASGAIGLVQAADIDTFTPDGLRLKGGETIGADLVVLATGYKNLQEGIRRLLGDEIADRVGPVWASTSTTPCGTGISAPINPGSGSWADHCSTAASTPSSWPSRFVPRSRGSSHRARTRRRRKRTRGWGRV
jgi:cation diffusion facilitator CzcD-associated flavoprotein CzcO